MNILHVASEVAPFAKTGGLADVASALPRAQARLGGARGDRVAVVLPRYRADPEHFGLARRLARVAVTVGGRAIEVGLLEGRLPGGGGRVEVWLIDHPLFDRPGIYGEGGADYPDNAFRFALLSRAALEVARAVGFRPDVVHAHDWQSSPALLYAKRGAAPGARTVLTVHNIAFLGQFPLALADELGFGDDLSHPDGVEFYGSLSFLKAGMVFADWITTVSPTYAREIQTPELGCGLDGLLRARRWG
jgi:starch synthase